MPGQGGMPAETSCAEGVGLDDSLGWALPPEEVKRQARGLHLLSLYHGPLGRSDGLDFYVTDWGAAITAYDLEIHLSHDLADDAFWRTVVADIEDQKYAAGGMAMPCGTFSAVRSFEDGGPVPLRGEYAPDLFGLPGISPQDKQKMAIGTLLALRGSEAANLFYQLGLPFWGETPHQRDGKPSVFKLPSWMELLAQPGVSLRAFVQCGFESRTTKPTDLVYFKLRIVFPTECLHSPQWWITPWSGATSFSPHPQLRGTQWMIPWADWRPEMLRWWEPSGPFISRSAAAYPGPLNASLAETWVRGAVAARVLTTQTASLVVTGRWANTLIRRDLLKVRLQTSNRSPRSAADTPQVTFNTPLRPRDSKPLPALEDPNCCICGLVDTWKVLDRIPAHKTLGPRIAQLIDSYFDLNPTVEQMLVAGIGSSKVNSECLEEAIFPLRCQLAALLAVGGALPDTEPVASGCCTTPIRAGMLQAWAAAARDPALPICEWLYTGAPAEIAKDTAVLDTLFPRVPEKDEDDFLDEVALDPDEFINYTGVDESDTVADILSEKEDTHCLRGCDTIAEVRAYLGSDPVLSKLAFVEKLRPDGTVKTRIIVDSKISKVSTRARRTHRSTLPRATHAIHGALGLMESVDGSQVYLLVADIQDAFWLIPLAFEERKFFVCKFRGRYLIFARTAQGSRGAPLTWAAIAALAARCVQSVFITPDGEEARLQMYVDDPLLAMQGIESRRFRLAARFLVVWLLLGFGVAFPKAKFSQKLVWIGVELGVCAERIVARIPAEKAAELLELIEQHLSKNVLSIKEVRSIAGKAMNIASLIYFWRPFLACFWAALTLETSMHVQNCIWVKQIAPALYWLRAFLKREQGVIERTFTLDAHYNRLLCLEITTDASPWGIGGWVALNHQPLAWFSGKVTPADSTALQRELGIHLAQQAFEALAIFVAIRQWKTLWRARRVSLRVRSDNVGALTVISALKGRGAALTLVARELAFEFSDCEYSPDMIEHLPGVANTVADVLSRRFDPSKAQNWQVPHFLLSVPEVALPERTVGWWKTLTPPTPSSPVEPRA